MLILKGDYGKSRVADILLNNTHSNCYVYYDYPIIYRAICVDSNQYSFKDFKEFIENELDASLYADMHYDYLIIYTNKKEEDLKEFINWLDKNVSGFTYGDVIVTCK